MGRKYKLTKYISVKERPIIKHCKNALPDCT